MVRKRGFEPLRDCSRQPLKLVRLPFRHFRRQVRSGEVVRLKPDTTYRTVRYFVVGAAGAPVVGAAGAPVVGAAGAGLVVPAGPGAVSGAGFAAAGGAGVPLTTEPAPRWPMIDSASARSMNNAAAIDVAFVSSVAPDLAPNAAWLLLPPNALAISPPRPCCRRMTNDRMRHVSTKRLIKT